ncbi:hypothetical protein [Thermocrinis sp.]
MVKWIVYLLVAFLLIDHLWIHYGGPFIERMRADYREELKKSNDWEQIQAQQAYKQSILDKIWKKITSLAKKDEGGKKDE